MLDYRQYLVLALESLFRDKSDGGFWDSDLGSIIRQKNMNSDLTWKDNSTVDLRYAPFALMGALIYRHFSNDSKFDDKILKNIDYIKNNLDHAGITDLHYGIFTSLVFGYGIYQQEDCLEMCINIIKQTDKKVSKIKNNELSLIVWGYSWLYEFYKREDEFKRNLFSKIRNYSDFLIQSQDNKGVFQTGDIRAMLHQRIMYVLWSLAKASEVTGELKYLRKIEKSLNYVKDKRMTSDNGFIWYPKFHFVKYGFIKIPIFAPRQAKWFFECHQTFFVNACQLYYQAGGRLDYTNSEKKAMEWIFASNVKKINLVTHSKIGIPFRIMHENGDLFVKDENFKGTYEIGSYIMALTYLSKKKT